MRQGVIIGAIRHPAIAVLGAAVFGGAALVIGPLALDQAQRYAIADDPAKISERALDNVFGRSVAEREIRSALAAGDADLARSFVELAAARNVAIDPRLADSLKEARADEATVPHVAGRFARGLWTGEPTDRASLAGTAVGDLFVFGDIRDAAREGTHYLLGQPADPWILGLAGVGIAVTAGTYASLGLGLPERIGVTLVKAARRVGGLNPALLVRAARETMKVEKAGGLAKLLGDAGRIDGKAGTRAALEGLAVAEEPRDVSRLAQLSAAMGGKTRAVIKLLGRGAIVLAVGSLEAASWLFWAVLMLFGFVISSKAAAERMTLRYLKWRKVRRVRAAALFALGAPLPTQI
jgi:hypothetical protein